MNICKIIGALILIISTLQAQPATIDYMDGSENEDMSIEFQSDFADPMKGRLISSNSVYYYFHCHGDQDHCMCLVARNEVEYLEINMDINLHALFRGQDANTLVDVIELNDGTRIPSIILDVGTDQIQYFTGNSMKREIISTSSIYMLPIL